MRRIFQTLRNENPDYVEENGPFPCKRKNAWLHNGYYFWDQDIGVAHWWGDEGYHGDYIICQSSFKYDIRQCWDLHNEHGAREEFRAIAKGIEKRNINRGKRLKVRDIIEELQNKGIFGYKAVRLAGNNSIGYNDPLYERHLLDRKDTKSWEYDNRPAIQICFYQRNALERTEFKIVFPEEYVQDEIVF